jgi:hypothetical protein
LPALIVFGTPRSRGGESGPSGDAVRVVEDAAAVVKKLTATKTGFASLQLDNEAQTAVWVNRELVRMVRQVQPKENGAE